MRNAIVIILLVAGGGLLWWMLATPEAEPLDLVPRDEGEQVSATDRTAVLQGANPLDKHGVGSTFGFGEYAITGIVRDASEQPVGGVPIELRASAIRWPAGGYRAVLTYHDATIRSRAGALLAGVDRQDLVVARLVSATDGRFVFRMANAGYFGVYALPAAPAVGSYDSSRLFPQGKTAKVELLVQPGVPLRGTVVDARNQPVQAQVRAGFRAPRGKPGDWRAVAQSDAQSGAFAFDAVVNDKLSFVVTLASGRRFTGFSAQPPFEDLVLRLPGGGGAIQGRVRTQDDESVADAVVTLTLQVADEASASSKISLASRSNAEGAYTFADLPVGTVTSVNASAPGFLATQRYKGRDGFAPVSIVADQPTTLDITLQRGSIIEGTVARKDDRTPISNATVTLYYMGWNPPQEETTTTDADGRYRFAHVGSGKFFLLPSHPTHFSPDLEATLRQRSWSSEPPPKHLSAELSNADQTIERNLTLSPGHTLKGIVFDPDDKPAEGAGIFLKDFGLQTAGMRWGMYMSMATEPETISGPDGRFELQGLGPRQDWVLFARKSGFAAQYSDNVSLTDGATADVVVRLQRQVVIRGRVLDGKGAPIADQAVFAGAMLHGAGNTFHSDDEGRFELHSLPASDLDVSARRGKESVKQKITGLKPGEVREGVELVFGNKVAITGHVRSSKGEPVAGVTVLARRLDGKQEYRQTNTQKDGGFRLDDVSRGRVHLQVRDGQTATGEAQEVTAPTDDVVLTYDRPTQTTISGRIVGPGGKLVPFADVTAYGSNGTLSNKGHAKDGAFEVVAKGEPPYRLWVSKARQAGGALLNVQSKSVEVPDPMVDVVVRLEGGSQVAGRVVDEAGHGVPSVEVRAPPNGKTRTDGQGRWRLLGLAPGRVGISVRTPRGYLPVAPVVVDDGAEDVEFHLRKGATIQGRIVVPDGATVRGGQLTARWPQGTEPAGTARGVIGQNLSFVVSGVPPDSVVSLEFRPFSNSGTDPARQLASPRIEGVRAGAKDVEIKLGVGVTIRGVVIGADGTPLNSGSVMATGDGQGWSQIDQQGRFAIGGLRPGSFNLFVRTADGMTVIHRQTVTAPNNDLRMELPELGSLSGTLTDVPADGQWVVVAADATSGVAAPGRAVPVTPNGTWEIPSLAIDRTWTVSARSQDGDSDRYAQSKPVATDASDVALTWKTGLTIRGRAVRGKDGPVARSWVYARAPGWSSGAPCDIDGNFVLRGLPPGTYALRCTVFGHNLEATQENVAAGTSEVRIDLLPR